MKKKTYLILCIFGGWFGLHQFATNRIASGILYLFTGGLFFIGWFYDIYQAYKEYKNIDNLCVYDIDPNYGKKTVRGYYNKKGHYVKPYKRK